MRFERSKEWWLARSRAEPEKPSDAGTPEVGDVDQGRPRAEPGASVRFGEFVHLLRRQRRLSIEEFADMVNIDLAEAQVIEEDPFYSPEPRTIYYLARAFNLSQQRLNEYAGLTAANDHAVAEGQQRYAARSESRSSLSGDELALLNAVVTTLEERASESRL